MYARRILALAFLVAATPLAAAPAADREFDRVYPSEFRDMLRDAKLAYGKEDYPNAFGLFERLACAGDKQSQSALGRMYLLGQGTARDDLTGYAWLKLAAEVIFPGYQRIVRQLEEAMDAPQLAIAREGSKQLSALYDMGATRMSCNKNASRSGHIVDEIVCTPYRDGNQYLLRRCAGAAPR
jgi:TPR repeat protein